MKIINKITEWYFSKRALPYWSILLFDCTVVLFVAYICYYLEVGGSLFANHFWPFTFGCLVALVPFIFFFHLFHTYSGIIRYSSFVDLYRVIYAVFFASISACCIHQILDLCGDCSGHIIFLSFKLSLIFFALTTCILLFVRIVVKVMFESYHIESAMPVAIYGTKAGGISLAKSINIVKDKKYNLRCFISDGKEMRRSYLLGRPVILNGAGIGQTLKDLHIKGLLVSPLKSEILRGNQAMVQELIEAGIKIFMVPAAQQWDGKSSLSHQQLHAVDVEDLLPRDKIEIDLAAVGEMLQGKRILITGAAGSIGSEMARQVAKFSPAELILVDQAETPMHDVRLYMARNHSDLAVWTIVGSITNKEQMEAIFREHRPEYVFHAAAYKHVPMMEDNPGMAVQNNVYGTRVIADLAVRYGTLKFVMISTDKAVNPTNVMGCSKRICEIYCQALNKAIQDGTCPIELAPQSAEAPHTPKTQFITTRFGNVLGSNGSVIPLFREQIRKGGPVTVTHPDIIRFFMLIPEACRLVLEAGTMGHGGEIFVFDMGEPVRIVDLAKRMIALSGAKGIEIKFTGLRDGEKLYEEVLNDAEQTKPTLHPKIKIAAVREYPYELALRNEKELHHLSYSFDDMAIVRKMKEIVPEYKSRQSKYEVLDKD